MNTQTMTRTAGILNTIGVKTLYWIDDKFHVGERDWESLAIATSEIIADAIDQGIAIKSFDLGLNGLAKASLEHDGNVAAAKAIFEEKEAPSGLLEAIYKELQGAGPDVDDLNDGQFELFEGLLKDGRVELIKLSFGDWLARKDELVYNDEVLYLIDYENKREDSSINGKSILEYITQKDVVPFSIVFTQICEPNDEQEKAADLYASVGSGESSRQFSVMSKRRLLGKEELEDLDTAFAPPLKRLAIGHTYRKVATICVEGYKKGMSKALDQLDSMPITDMYRAIFERTWEEGASEVDVVCRVLNVAQRKAMFDEIIATAASRNGGNFFPALTTLRSLSDIEITSEIARVDPYIAELHNAEVFDSDIINKMHLPLSCGDIFQKTVDGKPVGPKYILLAQPCDLMVRRDATRNSAEGTFVQLKELTEEEYAKFSEFDATDTLEKTNKIQKKYEITKYNGTTTLAHFYHPITVNLCVLDYCVWNQNGEVKFNCKNPPRESRMFLEGWLKRLREVSETCRGGFPAAYRVLCFINGPEEFKERPDPTNGDLRFPLQRIGRLRSPFAEAVMNAYLASLGRPAFDHPLAG